jgi:SOS response regulatory protein OraA/RecX
MQLHDNKEGKRVRAVFYLQQHAKSKEELEKVLRDYQERESYYYNVVTWLDRLLYAPDLLREDFRRRLRKEALSASL